jgi:acyl-CoA hydrolase
MTRFRIMLADLNPDRNGYGAVIFDHIDTAATDAAYWVHGGRVATKMTAVTYNAPVQLADYLSTWAVITKVGETSITMAIAVKAERRVPSENGGFKVVTLDVAEATAVFVAVDDLGEKKVPVNWLGTDPRLIKPPTA